MVTNPYHARNWARFGVGLSKGVLGAVLVWPDGGGHVAFYLGEDKDTFTVLGGNHSNSVSIMRIAKSRLLPSGFRWPKTYPLPTFGPVAATGAAVSRYEA